MRETPEYLKQRIRARLMSNAKAFNRIENKLKYLSIKQLELLKKVIDENIKIKRRNEWKTQK